MRVTRLCVFFVLFVTLLFSFFLFLFPLFCCSFLFFSSLFFFSSSSFPISRTSTHHIYLPYLSTYTHTAALPSQQADYIHIHHQTKQSITIIYDMGFFQTLLNSQSRAAANPKGVSDVPQCATEKPPSMDRTRSSHSQPPSAQAPQPNHRQQKEVPTVKSTSDARFQILADGSHVHRLSWSAHSRFASSLNGLVDGLFNRDSNRPFKLPLWGGEKLSPDALQEERAAVDATLRRTTSDSSLTQKWGTCHEVIGKGAFGKIKIAHKTDGTHERLYAVKVGAPLFILLHCIAVHCIPMIALFYLPFSRYSGIVLSSWSVILGLHLGISEKEFRIVQGLCQKANLRILHLFHAVPSERRALARPPASQRDLAYLLPGHGVLRRGRPLQPHFRDLGRPAARGSQLLF